MEQDFEEEGEQEMEEPEEEAFEEEGEEEVEEDEASEDEQQSEEEKVDQRHIVQPPIDSPEIEKGIRSVLNKVSEGNIEPMFQSLLAVVKQYVNIKSSQSVTVFATSYAKIFVQMNIANQQQMNAILSVNCAFICGLQRLLGDRFFVLVVRHLFKQLLDMHPIAVGTSASQDVPQDSAKDRVKNILNCFLHFFIFQSLTSKLLFDLIISYLMHSFKEADVEVLIFLLHNIGLQLRKADPVALKDLLTLADQKKNSYQAQVKMMPPGSDGLDDMKRLERKIGFLSMELQDIKNNKGTLTLQVKSVEHLQTWLKKSDHLKQSELLIQPVDLSADILEKSLSLKDLTRTWWIEDAKEEQLPTMA